MKQNLKTPLWVLEYRDDIIFLHFIDQKDKKVKFVRDVAAVSQVS